jgi:hypothetical protein
VRRWGALPDAYGILFVLSSNAINAALYTKLNRTSFASFQSGCIANIATLLVAQQCQTPFS